MTSAKAKAYFTKPSYIFVPASLRAAVSICMKGGSGLNSVLSLLTSPFTREARDRNIPMKACFGFAPGTS